MHHEESSAAVERSLLAALDALKNSDTGPWIGMFEDSGVMEFPYAPPGNPERLDGKAAIANYMAHYPEVIAIESVSHRGSYAANDVLVVEFRLTGTAVPTGNPFVMDYVGVIRHAEGRIAHYRDYWNPLVAQQALGSNDALVGANAGVAA